MNQSYGPKVEDTDLEFSLRSFLIKLSVSKTLTKPLSKDCRWEVIAYFKSLPEASTSKDAELWIPTDAKQWQQPSLITPIKSLSSEPLVMDLQPGRRRDSFNDEKGDHISVFLQTNKSFLNWVQGFKPTELNKRRYVGNQMQYCGCQFYYIFKGYFF
ncbi:hypothetical protein V2J09_017587 [Rumex salicifolius]